MLQEEIRLVKMRLMPPLWQVHPLYEWQTENHKTMCLKNLLRSLNLATAIKNQQQQNQTPVTGISPVKI